MDRYGRKHKKGDRKDRRKKNEKGLRKEKKEKMNERRNYERVDYERSVTRQMVRGKQWGGRDNM